MRGGGDSSPSNQYASSSRPPPSPRPPSSPPFRCEEWFFADKVGLTPEAFDLLGQGDKKWYCPKCKEKKAKKKAKKRQRERGGSPEAKQPRLKIKMGGMFGK